MSKSSLHLLFAVPAAILLALPPGIARGIALGQDAAAGTATNVVITVEPRHGKVVPPVEKEDLVVFQSREKRPAQSLTPLEGSPTQLLLLIDDSARETLGTQFTAIGDFVRGLPANTQVAIAYSRNGTAFFTQQFTTDHAAAAATIRLPLGSGGGDVNPYDSIAESIKKWPFTPDVIRRQVLMIGSGIEGLGGGYSAENPYVNAGIEAAQKAGVIVYAIYTPAAGHAGHSFWRSTWGQNFLSQIADETGGESYNLMLGSPVDITPFFNEYLDAQKHQYLLTFLAKNEKKGLQPIRVDVKEKNASIAAAARVVVQ
jgi:VWFA-related protein